MGLLDDLNSSDPTQQAALQQGLLALGAGLLSGSTGHYGQFAPALGAGVTQGMAAYNGALNQAQELALKKAQAQQAAIQTKTLQQQWEDDQAWRALAKSGALSAQPQPTGPTAPVAPIGQPAAQPPAFTPNPGQPGIIPGAIGSPSGPAVDRSAAPVTPVSVPDSAPAPSMQQPAQAGYTPGATTLASIQMYRNVAQRALADGNWPAYQKATDYATSLEKAYAEARPKFQATNVDMVGQDGRLHKVIVDTAGNTQTLDGYAPEKLMSVNTGGATRLVGENTGTVNSGYVNSISPDTAANNKTTLQVAGMTDARERAATKANIAKDFAVAGLDPATGLPSGGDDSLVDMIGQYKIPPPSGFALRSPRMLSVMARVQEKYPDYSAGDYAVQAKALKDFGTGKDGQAVQSANTALNHLSTIQQLAEAQKNGNIQLFNKIAQEWGAQTGQPAPTDLRAALTMVAPEISKAVVGVGGGVEDRAKAAAALNPNYSPAQLVGAIGTMKDLFAGRLTEAQRTYERTTHRKDFTTQFLSPAAQSVLASRNAPQQPAPNGNQSTLSGGGWSATVINPGGK